MTEKREVRNVAARDRERIWHWAISLGTENALTSCGQDLEWRRVVKRPGPDFPLELEPGDTLCYACHGIKSFEEATGMKP